MSNRVLIVDGQNVIFSWPEMRKLQENRHSLAREALIRRLTEYRDYTGIHVVVVFDGRGSSVTEATEPGGIQVFYSGGGISADGVIERFVAQYGNERDVTVATSDLLERQTAISFNASCISSEDLQELLERTRAELQNDLDSRRKS